MSKTIFEAYNYAKKQLEGAGIEDFGFEARQIIRHITGLENAQILVKYAQPLTPFQENNLTAILHQRQARYPLQYIFCEWDFFGRSFVVGPGVLIPRQDTEAAVEKALELIENKSSPKILDLCAGSGCIGLSLAAERPDSAVTLVEKYPEALRYLEKNRKRLKAENAEAVLGDIFESTAADREYDLIISNPPYIPADEMTAVSPEVHYEPETALYGGEDGLMFYRAIAANYKGSLKNGGAICFEAGAGEAQSIAGLLKDTGFCDIGTKSDLNGIERVVFGTVKQL